MLSDKVRDLASCIGGFYLLKNEGDYTRTEKELLALGITKLEFLDHNEKGEPEESLHITLNRPGLLIGKKGSNIDALSEFLQIKTVVHEDTDFLLCALIPYDAMDHLDGKPTNRKSNLLRKLADSLDLTADLIVGIQSCDDDDEVMMSDGDRNKLGVSLRKLVDAFCSDFFEK